LQFTKATKTIVYSGSYIKMFTGMVFWELYKHWLTPLIYMSKEIQDGELKKVRISGFDSLGDLFLLKARRSYFMAVNYQNQGS